MTRQMTVFKIVLVHGVERLQLMSVEFVLETILHVLIVQVFQMEILYQIDVMFVIMTRQITVLKIVQVHGVVMLLQMRVVYVLETILHVLTVQELQMDLRLLMSVEHAMTTVQMTVFKIVLVHGAVLLLIQIFIMIVMEMVQDQVHHQVFVVRLYPMAG